MKILVTGSTGLMGTALVAALQKDEHTVCRLIRPGTKRHEARGGFDVAWNPETGELGGAAVGADAVINLAGAGVAEKRWSAARKRELVSSRVDSTRALVTALAKMNVKPEVMISASAIGYYGNRGDEILTEESAAGRGFLAGLSEAWEAEARKAEAFGTRVVTARFGVVLAGEGGALPKMMLPFRFGLGGKIGSGKQYFSWVSLRDAIGILRRCLWSTPIAGAAKFRPVSGPVNVVSPHPLTNAEFTEALAKAMHRPAFFTVPVFGMRLVLGEMADSVATTSLRVLPKRIQAEGYSFHDSDLTTTLASLIEES